MPAAAAIVALTVFGVACSKLPGVDAEPRECAGGAADSARAVRTAVDTLNKLEPFRSTVAHLSRDAAGFRVVTMPEPGSSVRDGMAVVRVDHSCRVVSVVQTDSA